MRYGWLVPLALLALTHVTGLVTLGAVATDSMEPTMPPGTLFVAYRDEPEQGDIAVYTREDGTRVVHRVVNVTPDGLVTQGDANERTDQQAGIPPVNPARASTVPTIAGEPASVSPSWLKPIGILGGQALLLTYAIRSFHQQSKQPTVGWPFNRVQASHLLVAAGFLLLVASPWLSGQIDATGRVEVQGLVIPTTAQVVTSGGIEQATLGPLETSTFTAEGPTQIVRAPAVPGASVLASQGAVWAMLPTAILAWAGALVLRLEGH